MPETFLILLAGGVMLAAACCDPRQVPLRWLRRAGIIALTIGGVGLVFYTQRDRAAAHPLMQRVQIGLLAALAAAILGQLALVQVAQRTGQRFFAAAAFVAAVLAGANFVHEMIAAAGLAERLGPKWCGVALQTAACGGVAAMCGLALVDMLLGHAYLTASSMAIDPFRRLNLTLAAVLAARCVMAVPLVLVLQSLRPIEMLWGLHGLLILVRWLVGLAVPAVFVYMAHDCIRRRATQSATGILYVTGVLVFVGEIVALHLLRSTGLPF
jgi:hypothetical protein